MTKWTGSTWVLAALPWLAAGGGSMLGLGCAVEDVQPDEDPVMKGDDQGDDDEGDDEGDDTDTVADDVAEPEPTEMEDDTPAAGPSELPEGAMLMVDFDDWNGATSLPDWSFEYGDPEMPYTAGPFELTDETGDYTLEMVAGYDSEYALGFSNTMATGWGGGVGFWMGATDLSEYEGVAFWVKGSDGTGTMEISFGRPETDETCEENGVTDCSRGKFKFDLHPEWTYMELDFNTFTPGVGFDGDSYPLPAPNVTALGFNAHMKYVQDSTGEWVPEPSAFEITVDRIFFY
jgi:hypothetical protein